MATRTWIGGAAAVAQVWAGSVADAVSGSTYTLTFTDETGGTVAITYTVGGSETTTTVATAIAAAVNASVDPRVRGAVTAAGSVAKVTLTAVNAGVPFNVAATAGGTSGSWTGTGVTVANVGANDWNWKGNWADNVVPVAADNVVITGSQAIKYGLNQSGVALAGVTRAYASGAALGSAGKYLKLNCTGYADYGGGTAYVDFGSSTVSPIIATGQGSIAAPTVFLLGSGMGTLTVNGAGVEVAGAVGQTATVGTAIVGGGAAVRLGSGVTLTTYKQSAGTGEVGCAATTVQADGGTLTTTGAGAIGTIACNGATVYPNSTGTVTTLTCTKGTVDFTTSDASRTVTNATLSGTGAVVADAGVVTFTNKIALGGRTKFTAAAA
jgi:autotransporter family porin